MLDLESTLYILGSIILYALIRWIRSRPVPPDPWDNLSINHEHDDVIDVAVNVVKETEHSAKQ